MLSFIGKMFGSAKAGEKIIDGAMSGIDKLFYTDEEKAEDGRQAKRDVMGVYMKWLESTSGSRIARRLLAVGAFSIWAIEHAMSVVFRTAAIFTNELGVITADKFTEAGELLHASANDMQTLVGVVFAFYFGGPVLVDASANMLKKWAGTKAEK